MASVVTEESGAEMNFQGASSGQWFQSSESLDEWRSSDQVQNGTPSTSPYWDSDDEDGGPSPSDLYGKYTWKIDKFSQINKRELRSDTFEAGGLKWYILIYPKGCDVYNHLSLFLCVANYDKLLPGWSHTAQFTIALFNKDRKKANKFSDTLHRFWKKEHDWGWKKFMELSRVVEEFVDDDTLIIEAQVQVIRERADRPFRCLGYQYRRELIRHYLPNVELIFRRFMEEKQNKIGKLIEEKARWSSFRSFWLAMDQSSRLCMTRAKTDAILKVVVKNFYIEKEVTSTLVMHSLYTGLKALEGQSKAKKSKSKHIEAQYPSVPYIHMEEDVFVLVDDVLPLLEQAAREPLPPKEERGHQNRLQDEGVGEDSYNKVSESDERRLTERGRRTIEIFVLAHVFSKIEVAYQEAVALKKQEELIQEEAALLAISEQKRRHGGADKEKKSKKKQGKHKRNNHKGKDKRRDDKSNRDSQGKNDQYSDVVERNNVLAPQPELTHEKSDGVEDFSDASDSIECVPELIPRDSEDIDISKMQPLPTEVSSVQNGIEGRSPSLLGGDSSSTCSSDSFTTVVIKKPQNGNSRHKKNESSVSRGKNHGNMVVSDSVDRLNGEANKLFRSVTDARNQFENSRSLQSAVSLSKDRIVNGVERQHAVKKEGSPVSLSKEAIVSPDIETSFTSPPKNPLQKPFSGFPTKSESKANADRSSSPPNSVQTSPTLRSDSQKLATPEPTEKSIEHQVQSASDNPSTTQVTATTEKPSMSHMPDLSRPLTAPITTEPRLIFSTVSMVQTEPFLSRSVSFAGRFGPEPSASTAQNYVPQSHPNAIIGQCYTQCHPNTSSAVNASLSYAQATSLASSQMMHPHVPDRIIDPNQMNPSFSFGMVNHHRDVLQNGPLWSESTQRGSTRNLPMDCQSSLSEMQSFDVYNPRVTRSQDTLPSGLSAGTSGHHSHVTEEFPHIDIINDLLNDEHGIGKLSMSGSSNHGNLSNGFHYINRQYSFPGEVSSGPGPSISASRFLRTRSFYDMDGLRHDYGASGSIYDAVPQVSPGQPRSGYIGGVLANQWQMNGSDLPYNTNADSNSYHATDYRHMSLASNGYTVYRPSNGL